MVARLMSETITIRGTTLPRLGFGTWQINGEDCVEGVRDALEIGYRHLDTAVAYDNEREVGEGLRASGLAREDVWITSKVWMEDARADDVRASCEGSLERLGIDRLDLLLLHWPNPEVPLEETLGALSELRDDGRIRELGVSNFPSALLQEAVELAPVFTNQVEYHPFLAQGEVLAVCLDHDVLLTAYSPLAQGDVADEPVLREIGERHGKSPGQVALRWLVDQDHVCAVPKSASPERRRENFDILDFELSDEERARIAGLPKDRRQISPEGLAPEWD